MSKTQDHRSMKYSESIAMTQPSHSQKIVRLNRTASDIISYEDVLIASYLDELRKQPPPLSKKNVYRFDDRPPPSNRNKEPKPISPYLQRLPHSSLFAQQQLTAQKPKRPFSGTQSARLPGREKPKVDPKFIADTDKWDPDSGKSEEEGPDGEQKKKVRPISAPARAKGHRPTSAKSTSSTTSKMSMRSAYSSGGKRNRTFYRPPQIIKCFAYKNGQRDVFAEVSAPNIKLLLEQCTVRLGLTTAARRIFLSDGVEVLLGSDIERGAEVYISCGENFKDPLGSEKSSAAMKKTASWTVNGVVFEETKKKKMKPVLSKRLRKMLAQKNRRVRVFKNVCGQEMAEVVVTMDKFDTS
ncbi:doublecortin domain-containing protein 1-like [Ptychodera flava]|uniref:doublecortin domain-containing protein 1-like n=1 Tax=Ptychodera flava TaxID=63121 RepID=UPI003969D05E